MKVALYLRVSTTDQDPESQGREVRQFVADRGWETVETYQDVGVSGARARRPALDQLVKDAWRGRFAAVVVWDLDLPPDAGALVVAIPPGWLRSPVFV